MEVTLIIFLFFLALVGFFALAVYNFFRHPDKYIGNLFLIFVIMLSIYISSIMMPENSYSSFLHYVRLIYLVIALILLIIQIVLIFKNRLKK